MCGGLEYEMRVGLNAKGFVCEREVECRRWFDKKDLNDIVEMVGEGWGGDSYKEGLEVNCSVLFDRYKLNWKGQKLAEEMEVQLHEDGCVSHEDWKFMCSGVGYMKQVQPHAQFQHVDSYVISFLQGYGLLGGQDVGGRE